MEDLGYSNNRQIFYTNIWDDKDWAANLPIENWLAFVIGENKDIDAYAQLAESCLDDNVLYICAAGNYCDLIHDIFDEVIVEVKLRKKERIEEDFESSAITTWHNNFSEGFWFAIMLAHHPYLIINKILCIDFTNQGVKDHLGNLITQINNGWLPSEKEFEGPVFDV